MTQPSIITQAIVTMSSPEIAELTGKKLGHVNRDIRIMLDDLKDEPKLDHQFREEKDARGYTTAFHLDRELTDTLLTGYSAVVRRKVIARWHELEGKAAAPLAPAELSRMEILQLAIESEKGRLLAIEERDRAIATKAQIGSKREATAMATAASARRETTKLRALMGEAAGSASILAVQGKLKNRAFDWRLLKSYCKTCELEMGNSWNPGIQRDVKTYPAEAWMAVYDVDLIELFGEVAA